MGSALQCGLQRGQALFGFALAARQMRVDRRVRHVEAGAHLLAARHELHRRLGSGQQQGAAIGLRWQFILQQRRDPALGARVTGEQEAFERGVSGRAPQQGGATLNEQAKGRIEVALLGQTNPAAGQSLQKTLLLLSDAKGESKPKTQISRKATGTKQSRKAVRGIGG